MMELLKVVDNEVEEVKEVKEPAAKTAGQLLNERRAALRGKVAADKAAQAASRRWKFSAAEWNLYQHKLQASINNYSSTARGAVELWEPAIETVGIPLIDLRNQLDSYRKFKDSYPRAQASLRKSAVRALVQLLHGGITPEAIKGEDRYNSLIRQLVHKANAYKVVDDIISDLEARIEELDKAEGHRLNNVKDYIEANTFIY